ncbi:putative DNA primase/helicase [Sphingomonas sp. YR710]|uniref:phage/plasmid primase, P4 family n=1 Tax=Sphingomonas sp. YR710 TaxID=1882773 RepID=UPI00087E885A|nr:phage/plasmid primase, P4 family [Sphingomonas sp. YR710]SDC30490.1 putative DNA primase/helicase [Sphingomonas sp. YR710]
MTVHNLPSPMCTAALQYARRGWKVFPCRPEDDSYINNKDERVLLSAKSPFVGHGVKDATTDEEVIKGWWRRWPNAMIGLAMGGDGLFVLDFDPRYDEETGEEFTLESLKAELEAIMGCELPTSLAARTPSGGVHVYLTQPKDAGERLRNRVGTKKSNLPQHVDVRAEGGYVILPPSRCLGGAESGAAEGQYRWLRGKADAPVADAPAAVVELCRTRAKAEPAAPRPSPARANVPRPANVDDQMLDELRKYAMRGLDGECQAVRGFRGAGRNSQLNESALKVASLVAAGVLDEAIARASIEAAARDNPGRDDESALLATIASGWTAGINQPRDLGEITASIRDRLSRRSAPRMGASPPHPPAPARAAAPRPDHDNDGWPSSQGGGSGPGFQKRGPGGDDDLRLTRECAFLPQTDLGNLERFLKRYGRDFIYVEAWGWLAWDGRRWSREMALAALGRAIQDTMRAIQEEAKLIAESGIAPEPLEMWDAAQKAAHKLEHAGKLDRVISMKRGVITLLSDTIAKWGRTSEGAGHIKCIAGMAEARLSRGVADFDTDPLLVCVGNGTLIFTRGDGTTKASVVLGPHRRADLMTRMATADYRPEATCPAYDAFLERVQPDAAMRDFLDIWAGYNSLGDASAQKMAIFFGEGANGKGVWINTKRAILGDYAWAASINSFMDNDRQNRGSEATPDLAALAGRRMVTANEAKEGSKFDDGLVKELTSDEPKGGVRELLKAPFELQITFKNTVICNNTPRIGTDHGIRRRIQIVPWTVIIPGDEQDPRLKSRLMEEASGILNRMVRGALAFLDSGLPEPEAIREATDKYLDENDILGRFLTLCIERSDGATIGASALHELFAAWQTWAQLLPAAGKPWSPKYLAQQMEKKRFHKRKSSSMVWDGIVALYEPTHFLDSAGKPVVSELPPPRRVNVPRAPDTDDGFYPFDLPP